MRELASQPARRRQHLLSAYPELPVFMPQRVTPNRTLLDAAPAPFQVLLEREHIDLVWLDEELRLAPRMLADPAFRRFTEQPERYGFSVRSTSIPGERLFVRHGALHE